MTAPDDMTTKDNNQEGAPTMKYRKKPVVIEAMRLTDSRSIPEICTWAESCTPEGKVIPVVPHRLRADCLTIRTLEGRMTASPGDYIIRGVKGEFYPCKPDIFEATYEKAED